MRKRSPASWPRGFFVISLILNDKLSQVSLRLGSKMFSSFRHKLNLKKSASYIREVSEYSQELPGNRNSSQFAFFNFQFSVYAWSPSWFSDESKVKESDAPCDARGLFSPGLTKWKTHSFGILADSFEPSQSRMFNMWQIKLMRKKTARRRKNKNVWSLSNSDATSFSPGSIKATKMQHHG
jgi:hypothetical protein